MAGETEYFDIKGVPLAMVLCKQMTSQLCIGITDPTNMFNNEIVAA